MTIYDLKLQNQKVDKNPTFIWGPVLDFCGGQRKL